MSRTAYTVAHSVSLAAVHVSVDLTIDTAARSLELTASHHTVSHNTVNAKFVYALYVYISAEYVH